MEAEEIALQIKKEIYEKVQCLDDLECDLVDREAWIFGLLEVLFKAKKLTDENLEINIPRIDRTKYFEIVPLVCGLYQKMEEILVVISACQDWFNEHEE